MGWLIASIQDSAIVIIYITMACYVSIRMHLPEDASDLRGRLFRIGLVLFFIGCALTHLHHAASAAEMKLDDPTHWDQYIFRSMQIIGGAITIVCAFKYIKMGNLLIQFKRKI